MTVVTDGITSHVLDLMFFHLETGFVKTAGLNYIYIHIVVPKT